MIIEWRPIKELPGYDVSNTGEVMGPDGELLNQIPNTQTGRLRVRVTEDGVRKYKYVNRLVAMTFKPNSSHKRMDVAHKDGDLSNNNLDNLQWVTKARVTNGKRHKNLHLNPYGT